MKDEALRGLFRPLTRLEDDEEDHTITEAVNKLRRFREDEELLRDLDL